MKRWLRWVLGFVAVGVLAGCASGPTRDINDPTNSLVFGYIDMSDAPTSVSHAWLRQVAPPNDKPYWGLGVQKGVFYNSYLPPGSYQLSSFGGSSFWQGEHRYNFPRQGNQARLRITKPGIYYLGSFKYKKMKTGMFEGGKFDIERVKTPTEADLLKQLLDKDGDVKGSVWAEKIRARLTQLKS